LLSKFINSVKILLYPILFSISQVFIIALFVVLNSKIDINNSEILIDYINKNTLFILLIQSMIFIPIFYLVYKKYRVDKEKVSMYTIIKIIIVAILLSIGLNFLIIGLKSFMDIQIIDSSITFTVIFGTGILGPIIEELLFRGIVYTKFKDIFEDRVAFFLSVFIFAISHTGGIFQILFAFIIGYYLTYIYRKYHDIRLSMLAHIAVNMTSILISPFLLSLF